ncbi:GGDEF domain-containing protein [Halomonas sp. ANAO-440]|uniref:GGDEF domain-containing protein n=1 Tax=Halomonas sp. ANAO-440 TaxID=2861360 RepID=UPI001CAA5122|nr:diguanylate cyclase [Halomonas sp. ANAO-440]MBZ0329556.1 GGDEF domain-containing protein [Halomonas sp. ANAO-440]
MKETLLQAVESNLSRPWYRLRFSPTVEARFEADTSARRNRHLLIAGTVALVIYGLYFFNDVVIRPESLHTAAWIRFGLMTPLGIVALYCVHRGLPPAMREATMSATMIVAMLLSNVIFVLSTSPYSFLDTFSFGLILVVGNIVFSLRFGFALVTSLLCGVIMVAFVVPYDAIESPVKINTLVVFTSSAIFTLVANYRLEASERQSYLLLLREKLRNQAALKDNQTLTKMSATDPLTGVANRRHFDSALAQRWSEAITEQTMLGMLVIDIDCFKNYNDRYGHLQGDACLRQVAVEMQRHVRQDNDLVVRYGGEEFVVLLPNASSESAKLAAERIRQGIEALAIPNQGAEHSPVITVSIGVAVLHPSATQAASTLLKRADEALYQAKRAGRNRSVLAPDGPLPA